MQPPRQVVALTCLALVLVAAPAQARADPNGGLSPLGCLDLNANGCETTSTTSSVWADAIAPAADGADLYVVSNGTIYDVRPQADGSMALAHCWAGQAGDGCDAQPAIAGAVRQMAISPDGRFAYLATSANSAASFASIVVFRRDPASGVLSELQCVTESPDPTCPDAAATHVAGTFAIGVSPDGRYVDIAGMAIGYSTVVVSTLARAADGTLSEIGCMAATATPGCTTSPALSFPRALAESPDGARVYAVGGSSIVSLARDASGALHEIGCLSGAASADASCQVVPVASAIGSFALAPDGAAGYAMAGYQLWDLRAAPDGALQDAGCGFHDHPAACVPSLESAASSLAADGSMLYATGTSSALWYPLYMDRGVGQAAGGLPLPGPSALATTRAAVYYFAGGGLFAFARVPPLVPLCADTAVTVARPSGTIDLRCTDPRGAPLRFTLDTPPSHGTIPATAVGTLGAFQLPYVPAAGPATADSFTSHVDDGLTIGATQTVTVSIAPAAAPSPVVARGPTRARIALTLARAGSLRVRHGRATLTLRCGRARCSGTVELLRAGRALVRTTFSSTSTGTVRVTLHLPRSIRPSGSRRVHLRLRVSASSAGWRSQTVERAVSLVAAAG